MTAWLIGVFIAGAIGNCEGEAAPERDNSHVLARLSIAKDAGPIVIPVAVNNQLLSLLVDTGCQLTRINADRIPTNEKTNPLTLRIGAATAVRPPRFVAAPRDYLTLSSQYGQPIDGILGMDVMGQFIVQIDFQAREFRLIEPGVSPDCDWGISLPIEPRKSTASFPYISAIVADRYELFLIDMGACCSAALKKDLYDVISAETPWQPRGQETFFPQKGEVVAPTMRVSRLSVGPLDYDDLIVVRPGFELNVLGLQFFRRHLVTLDFPNSRIYLAPTNEFARHDETDMSGIKLVRNDGVMTIHHIEPDSPAEFAGLKKNDCILMIGDQSTANMDLWDAQLLFRTQDGQRYSLLIRRDGREYTVDLTLRREL